LSASEKPEGGQASLAQARFLAQPSIPFPALKKPPTKVVSFFMKKEKRRKKKNHLWWLFFYMI